MIFPPGKDIYTVNNYYVIYGWAFELTGVFNNLPEVQTQYTKLLNTQSFI